MKPDHLALKFLYYLFWPLLLCLSKLYCGVQTIRRALYAKGVFSSVKLTPKVISIGNISSGGTGKSPLVMSLVSYLLEKGFSPVVLSRGYKSGLSSEESGFFLNGKFHSLDPSWQQKPVYADEARMQSALLADIPVIIGVNRINSYKKYSKLHAEPTHIILDDGFQHLKIQRIIDIVAIDANATPKEIKCLPLGSYRESLSSLKNVNGVFFTRATPSLPADSLLESIKPIVSKQNRVFFEVDLPYCVNQSKLTFDKSNSFHLICGIANPKSLIKELEIQGVNILSSTILKDHEVVPLKQIRQKLSSDIRSLITTQKDFYRNKEDFLQLDIPVWVIPLKITLEFNWSEYI